MVVYVVCVFWQISSAACGYGFTLLACNTKDLTKLWGMGLNKDSQLGFQRTQHDRSKKPHNPIAFLLGTRMLLVKITPTSKFQ